MLQTRPVTSRAPHAYSDVRKNVLLLWRCDAFVRLLPVHVFCGGRLHLQHSTQFQRLRNQQTNMQETLELWHQDVCSYALPHH